MRVPAMTTVPAMRDIKQETRRNLQIPEIRVWNHPHWNDEEGEDGYEVFDSFAEAAAYIKEHPKTAEDNPLLAFRGYELNLWEMEPDLPDMVVDTAESTAERGGDR